MNIIHITTFLQGGAGRIIKEIAEYQKTRGHNVVIVTNLTEEIGYCNYYEYLNELQNLKIPCLKVDSTFKRNMYLNLKVVEKVRNILMKENIDIIHAHAAVPAMVGVIARSGINRYIPVIQTMHGWGTNKREEQEKMDVTIMNGLDKVITVSKNDEKLMIKKGVDNEKLLTIYNGIQEKDKYKILDKDIIFDIKSHRKNGYRILGCIGTICERKNQELLIEAINNSKKDEKIFCVFIGEGDKLNELRTKVKSYKIENRIKFYGYKANASSYIKYFDYYIFTSLSEGLSIALLEGLREKVPVICSDIPAFNEFIENNKTGYLFKSNNVDSLRSLLDEVLKHSYQYEKDLMENAYYEYNNKFTIDIMMKSYKKLYKYIIGEDESVSNFSDLIKNFS